jgi:hypothetical protein
MDKIIDKLICKVIGHSIITQECPVTGAKLSQCNRCSPITHSSNMSFR